MSAEAQRDIAVAALNHLAAEVAEMAGRGVRLRPSTEKALDDAGNALARIAEIEKTAPPSGWQPIKTAPKNGTRVDLWFASEQWRAINCFWIPKIKKWGWFDTVFRGTKKLPENQSPAVTFPNVEPTHWMPLPELPPETAP